MTLRNTNKCSQVFAGVLPTLATLVVLCLSSCAKTSVIEEKNIDETGTYPLSFTNAGIVQSQAETKASSSSLTTGFVVSTWKRYGAGDRQTVMDMYEVQYKTSGTAWDGNVRPYWDYTGVSGQYEKYWDLSAFPYRFHAISPCPTDLTGFQLDGGLKIPASYSSQICVDGTVSPSAAEPYLVAQVQRDPDGRDYDVYENNTEINMTGASSLTRPVALPFHHLNCKVRFSLYATAPWLSSNHSYISNLKVQSASPNFVTSATGYEAGFVGLTRSVGPATILSLTGQAGNSEFDLINFQTPKTAYWLKCKDGLAQMPQDGVQLRVSFDVVNPDGSVKRQFDNVPVMLVDGTDTFNWQPGYIYTYNLVITEIGEKLAVEFTCTLTPWVDVMGSFSTDLEQ